MADTYRLETTIPFWSADRDQLLTLKGIFNLLQEGAILHADQHDLGSQAMVTRGDTWFLNRIAAAIHRYPRRGETVRLTTWSSGIRIFKGFREFRLHAGDELLLSASSLWLHLNLASKTLVRVPRALAAAFPARDDDVFHPDIEHLRFDDPSGPAATHDVSVRFSDLDLNGHVNNAAYFDCLQTVLAATGGPVHPARLELHFLKEIPPDLPAVSIRTHAADGQVRFSFEAGPDCFAKGCVSR